MEEIQFKRRLFVAVHAGKSKMARSFNSFICQNSISNSVILTEQEIALLGSVVILF